MAWMIVIVCAYAAIIMIAEVTRPGYEPGDWRRYWGTTVRLILKGE